MKNKKNLSELHQMFVNGDLSKKDFEGRIFQFLLDNFERYHLFEDNRDRWNEFLSWLYPRLVSAIDRYRDLGSSFDAYITSLIHGASREYQYRESEHYITEYACWRARAEDMFIQEEEPDYFAARKNLSIPKFVKPRQILLLLLKSYYFTSDEFVKNVAISIGMESTLVFGMIEELRRRRSGREAEIRKLKELLHCQYLRCLAYRKRMCSIFPGTEFYQKMKDRLERARKRYYAMKKRFDGMRVGASNRLIAEVLGIPKGTVDSCLFAIKNRLSIKNDMYKAMEKNQSGG